MPTDSGLVYDRGVLNKGQSPIIAGVVAKMRDGGKVEDLDDHERAIWAALEKRRIAREEWNKLHPGVPFKHTTRKTIEAVATLEIQDNLTFTQIGDKLGRTFKSIQALTHKYPAFYRDRLEIEILQRRQALMAAVEGAQFQSIKKHIAMVPAADAVIENVLDPERMPLTDNNAFAKLAAAKEVRKTVGADISSIGAQMEVAKLGSVVRDLIGVVRTARGEKPEIQSEAELLPAGDSTDEDEDEGDDAGLSGV